MNTVAAVNLMTLGVTEYSRPWVGVGISGESVYGLTATGLEAMSGTIEESAEPQLMTGDLGLSPGSICNIPLIRTMVRADRDATITAVVHINGESQAHDYTMPGASGDQDRERRLHLGRGFRGPVWAFKVSAAGSWLLTSLSVVVSRIKRGW